METKQVYLDNAATTPIDPRVKDQMEPFIAEYYGNPSSFHTAGKIALDAIEESREKIAGVIGVRADEIIFTSGGTEADNLMVLGFARANKKHGNHIITTKVEHPAVLEAVEHLEKKEGFEVSYAKVDQFGRVDVKDVVDLITEQTILVSIIYGNNEIGTIIDIKKIGAKIKNDRKERKSQFPIFHTDACQAVGSLEVDVQKLNVDAMTINASKIYGPKGVGALYLRRGLKVQPLQFGGSQENRKRPGTENVIGIVGFGAAVVIAEHERKENVKRQTELRDYFIKQVLEMIPKTRLNGHATERLANNVNISFMDLEGEALLLYLDNKGVYAATGSACTSATLDPSHVILALGLPYEVAHGSLRFTLGRGTTKEDLDYVLSVLPALVDKLRKISPVSVDPKYYT